jgi:hypothetical protein
MSMLKYSINIQNARVCNILVEFYREAMLPISILNKTHRLYAAENAASYKKSLPVCDLIDVKDLVALAEKYPKLVLRLIENLSDVPHDKRFDW